jgi:hypothetical protein
MKTKQKISKTNSDLAETADDKKHLKPDEANLDLPDVNDIPGQEHIHVPKLKEYADTTISSDDEEGVGVLDNEDDTVVAGESNVTKQERQALTDAANKNPDVKDEDNLARAQLDDLDEEGEVLNEKVNVSGSDLDIPGSDDDNADEDIGEEDEENNSYSLDSEDEDDSISHQS